MKAYLFFQIRLQGKSGLRSLRMVSFPSKRQSREGIIQADAHNMRIRAQTSAEDYQLAFFTPGIRPAEAISRNWIREMPN